MIAVDLTTVHCLVRSKILSRKIGGIFESQIKPSIFRLYKSAEATWITRPALVALDLETCKVS